jgi:hypothetical protein
VGAHLRGKENLNVARWDGTTPRLLSSAGFERVPGQDKGEPDTGCALKRSGIFCGLSRHLFLGILLGALLLSLVGAFYTHRRQLKRNLFGADPSPPPRVSLPVVPKQVSAAPVPLSTPAHVIIHITPEVLHLTSIALGHPRLAVVNGRSFAEGDKLTVHIGNDVGAVTLTVIRIADGSVELTDDGVHIITVKFEQTPVRRLH